MSEIANRSAYVNPRTTKGLPSCEGCRFWSVRHKAKDGRKSVGDCRRHAPVAILTPPARSPWPPTTGDAWCGDHLPAVIVHIEVPDFGDPGGPPLEQWTQVFR